MGVDANEFLGYLEEGKVETPPLGQLMGMPADPAAGEGGLPTMTEGNGDLTEDQKLLEHLKGIQRQTAVAIKTLEKKIAGGK